MSASHLDQAANGLILQEPLRPGQMWSRVLKSGQVLRLTDVDGGGCVAALFYNADHTLERYNMPDTLKAQRIARLTTGAGLYSDMGRVLCSIVADTCGWHDTITGISNAAMTRAKYGEGSYQKLRNDFFRNSRDNFLTELGKYEMGKRDIVANVNFFVKVAVDNDGNLKFAPGNSKAGNFVELRAGLNTLVVLSNTPHPLDPSPHYAPKAVSLTVRAGLSATEVDPSLHSSAENERAFELTRRYFA
ncbi:MAG TPA: urea amidolyase associated protein UAAP1 [Polyangiaceae bacterium]|jgi:urea carboxylase-associated protein 2|nr:urea amidolyase associated protein UAAP1 [Polyangiaceae bacterium]